ncbi:MAG: SUMF1/EgtB/PvdO family nonheme iron enzyme [Cyanobacteria bacterium J06634_6]
MTRDHGISIGINGNEFSLFPPLKYAKSDAVLFASFLRDGAKFDEVWLFSDDSSKIRGEITTPSRTRLRRFFRDQFAQPFMSEEDSLWLFFSGHGSQHNGVDYVLPIDGDPEDPKETGISLDWIVEKIRNSGAGEIVLIVDMCRTEGRKGSGVEVPCYKGITTIFSCKPNEASWEINAPISKGAFTHVLLKSLNKQVTGEPITIAETESTLQRDILLLNRKYRKEKQTPHIRCESADRANSSLFSPLFLATRGVSNEASENSYSKFLRKPSNQRNRSKARSLKKKALEAEETKNLRLAEKMWDQVIRADTLEQESYIKAIKRITEARILEPYATTGQNAQKQLGQKSTQVKSDINHDFQKGTDRISQLYDLSELKKSLALKEYQYSFQTIDSVDESIKLFQNTTYYLSEKVSDVEIEMVLVPGGTFLMGSSEKKPNPSELPKHKVEIKTFLMSKHPITKLQWKVVARQSQIDRALKLRPSLRGGKHCPAVENSWYEAVEFCARLTETSDHEYRLPTEAEWEYACRAGFTSSFHFGERITKEVAQFDSDGMVEVCQFLPNAYGLNGMHGNVWEWCIDHWNPDYTQAPLDGKAWLDSTDNPNRVLRGGSWRNELKLCRSACRVSDAAESRSNSTGFRIVRPL